MKSQSKCQYIQVPNDSSGRFGLWFRRLAVGAFASSCIIISPQAAAECQQGCDDRSSNTFLGESVLINNSAGFFNVGIGFEALLSNDTGDYNTGVGAEALRSNTDGLDNTAVGFWSLYSNTTGGDNIAVGNYALYQNTTGVNNIATGFGALSSNTTGSGNIASGTQALSGHMTGFNNVAIGGRALEHVRSGSDNIGIGIGAGQRLRADDSNNIVIGSYGRPGESDSIRIGRPTHRATYVEGISKAIVPEGVPVIVDSDGHLGTVVSSARFKKAIQPMDKASEAILSLKPVTFRYKEELDPGSLPQFGLVAEDVARIDSDLVVRDERGKPYSVRYEAVNAMLLNEFLKEHRKVEELTNEVADLKAAVNGLKAIQKLH